MDGGGGGSGRACARKRKRTEESRLMQVRCARSCAPLNMQRRLREGREALVSFSFEGCWVELLGRQKRRGMGGSGGERVRMQILLLVILMHSG
jgi:hypothetical protein